jgi:hypothetical protein
MTVRKTTEKVIDIIVANKMERGWKNTQGLDAAKAFAQDLLYA